MFAKLFTICCCRASDDDDEQHEDVAQRRNIIDENTRLIPDTLSPSLSSYSSNSALINQHRIRERLGTIVRAKERKMVNVVSQIPFNLHKPPTRLPHHQHSRSRSLSESVSSEHLPHHHDSFTRHRSNTQTTLPPTSRFYSDPNPHTLSSFTTPINYIEEVDHEDVGGPKTVFGTHIVLPAHLHASGDPHLAGSASALRRGRSTNSRYPRSQLPNIPNDVPSSDYRSDEEDADELEDAEQEDPNTPTQVSERRRHRKDILNLKDSGAITFSWGD